MRISIHQPQYIPWLPYFLKVESSDLFVILDTVDFQKNGLQNRNAIKTPQGLLWLTVPVSQKLGTPINEVKIADDFWRDKHLKTLIQNYKKAAYFENYFPDMEKILSQKWERLSDLNLEVIKRMMVWLGIEVPIVLSSTLDVHGSSSDLILDICKAMKATTYVSGSGGKHYLVEDDFKNNSIALDYQASQEISEYEQQFPKHPFVPHLSALDILFNCGENWRKLVKNAAPQIA